LIGSRLEGGDSILDEKQHFGWLEAKLKTEFGKTLDSLDSIEEYETALNLAGKLMSPVLLYRLYGTGRLDTALLSRLLCRVWCLAEWPETSLSRKKWMTWFRQTGFLADPLVSAPTEPLLIFRGCSAKTIRRMAWTMDRGTAAFFASYLAAPARQGIRSVYSATISPEGVLAILDSWKGKREVVVDPRYLREIERIESAGEKSGPLC
jgi:hypothetical protein